jgi:TatD DNase family protein
MPHRGKTNEPAWVSHVAEFVANLKGVTVEELARVTTHNFKTLFKAPI